MSNQPQRILNRTFTNSVFGNNIRWYGWDTDEATTSLPNNDVHIFNNWDIGNSLNLVTITFNMQGGSFEDGRNNQQHILSGMPVQMPPSPVRPGYNFLGWFTTATAVSSLVERTSFQYIQLRRIKPWLGFADIVVD